MVAMHMHLIKHLFSTLDLRLAGTKAPRVCQTYCVCGMCGHVWACVGMCWADLGTQKGHVYFEIPNPSTGTMDLDRCFMSIGVRRPRAARGASDIRGVARAVRGVQHANPANMQDQ